MSQGSQCGVEKAVPALRVYFRGRIVWEDCADHRFQGTKLKNCNYGINRICSSICMFSA